MLILRATEMPWPIKIVLYKTPKIVSPSSKHSEYLLIYKVETDHFRGPEAARGGPEAAACQSFEYKILI